LIVEHIHSSLHFVLSPTHYLVTAHRLLSLISRQLDII
jgi:hypothetical protein